MKTTIITIPSGTNYLSDVMDDLPHNAYINKGVTGCGGTTLALTNDKPYVVAVHSTAMVLNKIYQHPEVFGVYCKVFDEDIKLAVQNNTKKYIVTYDALPRLCQYLNTKDFHLLVDEVQVLIRYAGNFKIKVCNELIHRTVNFKTVSYLTATPTPIKYLPIEMTDLYYIEYRWEDMVKPIIKHKYVGNLFNTKVVTYILDRYTNTNKDTFIFYNSISGVITAIKKLMKADSTIKLDDINIFFSNNDKNTERFKKQLGKNFKYGSTIPGNEKRINFVSSMGFEGIDFYNKEVSVLVASDARFKSMRYDVSIDIPQIIGRFRNVPTCPIDFIWSSHTDESKMSEAEFISYVNTRTISMAEAIAVVNNTKNTDLDSGLKLRVMTNDLPYAYIDDFEHLQPNEYAYSSLMSSFSSMHCDYFVLDKYKTIEVVAPMLTKLKDLYSEHDTLELPDLSLHHQKNLNKVFSFTVLSKKYCNLMKDYENIPLCLFNERKELLDEINTIVSYSENLQKYHRVISPSNIASSGYNMKLLDSMYDDIMLLKNIKNNPLNLTENTVYELSYIKDKLWKLYIDNSIDKKPKTSDLDYWYDTKKSTVLKNNSTTTGIKIISIK